MAAVRRAISAAAAAGRYGVVTFGRQDAPYPSMATLHRALSSPTAAGKLGLGSPGLKIRSMSAVPKWMSDHHKKVAVDPELAFHNLRADCKDVVVLMHITASDQTRRVLQRNDGGVEAVLFEFARLYDKQLDLEQSVWVLVIVLVAGVGSIAYFVKDVKNKFTNILKNVASHSGSIVAALVSAGKHGADSWVLGKGEPFTFDYKWLKEKKQETEGEQKKGEKTKIGGKFGKSYLSTFFSKPEDK